MGGAVGHARVNADDARANSFAERVVESFDFGFPAGMLLSDEKLNAGVNSVGVMMIRDGFGNDCFASKLSSGEAK